MLNRYFSSRRNSSKLGSKVTSKHVDSLGLCPNVIKFTYLPLTGFSCFLDCKHGSIYVCCDSLTELQKEVKKLYLSSYLYVNSSLIPRFIFRLIK